MRSFGLHPSNKPIYASRITYQSADDRIAEDGGAGGTRWSSAQLGGMSFVQYNEAVGLPRHPATNEEMPLMPFQVEFAYKVHTRRYKKHHVNKARQIGFTELINRLLGYGAFTDYKGKKIMILAGTREKTTKKIMIRFQELFNRTDSVVDKNDLYMKLDNGTEVEGLPSNSEAIRGDTKIAAIFMDEAAHYGMNDDSVVMDAIRPIVDTNKSDLFMVSTPNGPQGFFYDTDRGQNDYHKSRYNIWAAQGWIYSKEEIEAILAQKDIDVEQEFLNQYTTSRNSIFGESIVQGAHQVEEW